jgi:sugar phosphate isomerase/epimerase
MIHALGADRLGALHVHDNDGKRDIHQLPYHMAIDWDEILDALADVGYRGDFTLEADNFYGRLPKELLEDAAGHMAKVSHHMVNHILTRRGETT